MCYTASMTTRSFYKTKHAKNIPEWIRLYDSGKSFCEIGREYGTDGKIVKKHLQRHGIIARTPSEMKLGELNPMWKGDDVASYALHQWVASRFPKPELCSTCQERPALDLANISPKYNPKTYNRDLSNWEWLCRRCHMIKDGRIKNLKQYNNESSKTR